MIEFVEDRLGHDRRYALDVTKIYKDLEWKANTDFEEAMKMTIQWYVKSSQ